MNKQQTAPAPQDGLAEITVELRNMEGRKMAVPGLIHTACPGLAVTMLPFGVFSVTHIQTGLRLCQTYERAASAMLTLSQFALIADMRGVSWADLDQEGGVKLIDDAGDDEVPFGGYTSTSREGTRAMTISEWFQFVRDPFPGEFPWEESDPFELAIENLEKLGETV